MARAKAGEIGRGGGCRGPAKPWWGARLCLSLLAFAEVCHIMRFASLKDQRGFRVEYRLQGSNTEVFGSSPTK